MWCLGKYFFLICYQINISVMPGRNAMPTDRSIFPGPRNTRIQGISSWQIVTWRIERRVSWQSDTVRRRQRSPERTMSLRGGKPTESVAESNSTSWTLASLHNLFYNAMDLVSDPAWYIRTSRLYGSARNYMLKNNCLKLFPTSYV